MATVTTWDTVPCPFFHRDIYLSFWSVGALHVLSAVAFLLWQVVATFSLCCFSLSGLCLCQARTQQKVRFSP